jgi:thioredoxin-like negative regulator of GroEL
MTPIVDGLAEKYQAEVVTKRINANEGEGPDIMRVYGIRGHPTLLIFDRQGQEVRRFSGPQPVEVIEQMLQELLLEDETLEKDWGTNLSQL